MIDYFHKSKVKYELATIKRGGYSLDKMRNMIVKDALDLKADYLLFLDTDMSFPDFMITRMLKVFEANKNCEAVTGVYTWKKEPYLPQLFGKFDQKKKKFHILSGFILNQPFWVVGAGLGAMMVKADLFRRVKEPWFKFVEKGEDKRIPLGLGEDLYFAWKCKPKMLCDPQIVCGHYDIRPVGLKNYVEKNGLKVEKNKILITKEQAKEIDKKHQNMISGRKNPVNKENKTVKEKTLSKNKTSSSRKLVKNTRVSN